MKARFIAFVAVAASVVAGVAGASCKGSGGSSAQASDGGGGGADQTRTQGPPSCAENANARLALDIPHLQDTSDPRNASVWVAPAIGGRKAQPQAVSWNLTDRNHIFNYIFSIANIRPCDTDPLTLDGGPGFLEPIPSSQVIVPGGTRATFAFYIRSNTGEISDGAWYTALFSYDRVVPDDGGAPVCATEFFLFTGDFVSDCGPPNPVSPFNPPSLMEGLAIDRDTCLLDSVPLTLAQVAGFVGTNDGVDHEDASEPVLPGVNVAAHGCLLCHAQAAAEPQHTVPFPWYFDDATCCQPTVIGSLTHTDLLYAPPAMAGSTVLVNGTNLGDSTTTVVIGGTSDGTPTGAVVNPTTAAVAPGGTPAQLSFVVPAGATSGVLTLTPHPEAGQCGSPDTRPFVVGENVGLSWTSDQKCGAWSFGEPGVIAVLPAGGMSVTYNPFGSSGLVTLTGQGSFGGSVSVSGTWPIVPSASTSLTASTITGTLNPDGSGSGTLTWTLSSPGVPDCTTSGPVTIKPQGQ